MSVLLVIEVIKYIIFIFHALKCGQTLIGVCNPPVQDKASHLLCSQTAELTLHSGR